MELRSEQGKKFIKIETSLDDNIQTLLTHPKEYSTIMERWTLQFAISMFKIAQYLPPVEKDSNIYLDMQAIILEKDSEFEFIINRMYVIISMHIINMNLVFLVFRILKSQVL